MQVIMSKYLISSVEEVYVDHALVVDKEDIIEIIPNNLAKEKYANNYICDKRDSIIMPGFINAHMHQYGVLSRGIPANVEFRDFEGFLKDYWWPFIENRIGLEEVLITAKASAIELLESGVIGFCDTLEAPNTEDNSLIEQAKVIEKLGMKAILSLESCERISPENGLRCLRENENFIRWSRENSKLTSGLMCTHTSFTCSDEFLSIAKNKAQELDVSWQFHLSESIYEVNQSLSNKGKLPVNHYDDLNLLDDKVIASQCVKVSQEEIQILREKGVRPIHMPLSNCEVGGGFSPVPNMIQSGIDVALGSDGYINDFFEVMRGAFLMHKSNLEDASVMPSKLVFKMATENGAKVLGWTDTGSLKPKNKADFIVMNDKFKTPVTLDNLFDQIVVHGDKAYIDRLYVNGKLLVENGQVKNIDKDKVFRQMRTIADRFWSFK